MKERFLCSHALTTFTTKAVFDAIEPRVLIREIPFELKEKSAIIFNRTV